jgi:anti-anti-sigma factor
MAEALGALTQTPISPFKQGSFFAEDLLIPAAAAQGLTDARCRQESPALPGGVLKVRGFVELTAAHGRRFRNQVLAALDGQTVIEIDLSPTTVIDCAGVGALFAIRNLTPQRKGVVRLMNPRPRVQQLLELVRAEQAFEIVKSQN